MNALRLIQKNFLPMLAVLVAHPPQAAAQSVRALVDSQNYVFQPRTAQPLRGPVHDVTTSLFTLQISKTRIVSDLPYFGRAYVAPIDPTKGALEFTLNHFDYTMTPGKKEGWNVVIRPRDRQDIQELRLNISSAGYTSLQVISTNRDAIEFDGIITAPGKR